MADLILTSKLGTFVFDKRTIVSRAKLIRDSITGHFFHPRMGEPKIKNELDAQNYARNHLGQILESIPFSLKSDFLEPIPVVEDEFDGVMPDGLGFK